MPGRFRYRLRTFLRRSALDREMREEMQIHLDRRIATLVARGMSPSDARFEALREFGNVGVHQAAGRDAWRTGWLESVFSDVRFALRHFVRKPLSTATIVLALAFGIAGHAFQMSLLLGMTARTPPGMPDDIPVVRLRGMQRPAEQPSWSQRLFAYPELLEIADLRTVFSRVAGWTTSEVVADVQGSLDGEAARAFFVTDDYFSVLGVQPTFGPGLPRDAGEPQLVAVISRPMWESELGSADITGKTIRVNGSEVRVVGVAPARFGGATDYWNRRAVWIPLSARGLILGSNPSSAVALSSPDSTLFDAVAQLREGVSPQQATAAIRVISGRAVARMTRPADAGANDNRVYDADVVPLRGSTEVGESDMPVIAAVWGVITTLVLLVVCANVSALVVSAAVGRQQEIAVRLSLGASRGRLIRQLLTESALLALTGGSIGLFVYWAVIAALSKFPEADWLRPDLMTVGFTMAIAFITAFVFGLAPALHATRQGVAGALKSTSLGTTRRSRLQRAFIVAQVTLTQPLLVLIAVLIGPLLMQKRPVLRDGVPERVLRLSIDLRSTPGSDAEKSAAVKRLVRRVSEMPGVVRVLPDAQPAGNATLSLRAEDRGPLPRASAPLRVDMQLATAGYFALLDAPLLRGDDRAPADSGWTMIVSNDLARALWGDADPIGRRFTQISPTPKVNRDIVVTGVYDSRYLFQGEQTARIYRQVDSLTANQYLIRTAAPASDLAKVVRQIVRQELPSTPIQSVMTLAAVNAESMKEKTYIRAGVLATAAIVLLLTSIGLYGVIALAVAQRRREIGVLMALGAGAQRVVGVFYRSGVLLAVLGLAIGLPISLFAGRMLDTLINNPTLPARPNMLVIGAIIVLIVLGVASVATLLPASRAARVNPSTALRND